MPSSSPTSQTRRSRAKKPKKSAAATSGSTLFYCLGLYLAYSIFTREDDPNPYAISPPGPYHDPHPSSHSYPYPSLPHLPHLPSLPQSGTTTIPHLHVPLPTPPPTASLPRLILTFATYPFILLFNLLTLLLSYLSSTLLLLLLAAHYLASPALETISLLSRTFYFPIRLLGHAGSFLYPVYKLVGGLMGVGATMGLMAGWVGKVSEDKIYASARARAALAEEDPSPSPQQPRYRTSPPSYPKPSSSSSRRSSTTIRPIHIYSTPQPLPARRKQRTQRISFAEPETPSSDEGESGGSPGELHFHIYPQAEAGAGEEGEVVGLRKRGRVLGKR